MNSDNPLGSGGKESGSNLFNEKSPPRFLFGGGNQHRSSNMLSSSFFNKEKKSPPKFSFRMAGTVKNSPTPLFNKNKENSKPGIFNFKAGADPKRSFGLFRKLAPVSKKSPDPIKKTVTDPKLPIPLFKSNFGGKPKFGLFSKPTRNSPVLTYKEKDDEGHAAEVLDANETNGNFSKDIFASPVKPIEKEIVKETPTPEIRKALFSPPGQPPKKMFSIPKNGFMENRNGNNVMFGNINTPKIQERNVKSISPPKPKSMLPPKKMMKANPVHRNMVQPPPSTPRPSQRSITATPVSSGSIGKFNPRAILERNAKKKLETNNNNVGKKMDSLKLPNGIEKSKKTISKKNALRKRIIRNKKLASSSTFPSPLNRNAILESDAGSAAEKEKIGKNSNRLNKLNEETMKLGKELDEKLNSEPRMLNEIHLITQKLEDHEEDMKELAVRIAVQTNRILMLRDPKLICHVDELRKKYCTELDEN